MEDGTGYAKEEEKIRIGLRTILTVQQMQNKI
jgi:hypothetical protein